MSRRLLTSIALLALGALALVGWARAAGGQSAARVVVRPALSLSANLMGQDLTAVVQTNGRRPYTLTAARGGQTLWQATLTGSRSLRLPYRAGETLTLTSGY